MRITRRTLLKGSALSVIVAPFSKFDSFAGQSLIEPKRIKSVKGVLNVTLEAKETMLPFEGSKRWALTYNGTFPGPTLVAKPGDVINVVLKNSTNQMTNLHTHGPIFIRFLICRGCYNQKQAMYTIPTTLLFIAHLVRKIQLS